MKKIIRLVALCAALIVSDSAFAQQYPSKPVRVVVPFPPGGVTDIAGRLIAQKLSERLGHQFYIENISGAVPARVPHLVRAAGRRSTWRCER